MNKLILTLLIGFVGFLPFRKIHAQVGPGGNSIQDIETLKIAFISKQLDLTPDEAQKFWPVYNQYSKEIKQLRQQFNASPDKDELKWQEDQLNIRKKYRPEFLKCIPQQKFDKLLRVDAAWKEKLRQEIIRRQQSQVPARVPAGQIKVIRRRW
jgi:hypothetical protein